MLRHSQLAFYSFRITAFVVCAILTQPLFAQDAPPKRPQVPVIPEGPVTVDPATLVHPKLAQKATVEFDDATLAEMGQWLEEATGLPVVVDVAELANDGRSLNEEYSDQLNDAPIYFLLNRLESLSLGWFVDDEILHISTRSALDTLLETKTYTVGDLLDAGYTGDAIIEAIHTSTLGPWQEIDQDGGTAQLLGDVLFVNHTAALHLEIAGLLSALRKHGRETYTFEPTEHSQIRERLQAASTIDFKNEPLFRVVETVSQETGLDIRLDRSELSNDGVSHRDTVSLTIRNRKLKTILNLLFGELALTTTVRNGVVLVTTEIAASGQYKTVVYNVSDLCQNDSEADALIEAIQVQTSGPWQMIDQDGGDINFPKHDTMLVRQTEAVLSEIRNLLATYREALRVSKPRQHKDEGDSKEIVTHFYKLDTAIAEALFKGLWNLIPEGKVEENAEQNLEKILLLPSQSIVRNTPGTKSAAVDVAQSTMIITHRKEIHRKIQTLISRIESGDAPLVDPNASPRRGQQGGQSGGMGGGGGQGSFGGGFFSIPKK